MDHFLAADTGHDGRVSREEFIAYQRQTALADFLAADTNRDGKVDRREFAAFQRKQAAAAAAEPAAAAAAPTEWRVRLTVGADATVRATIAPPESLAESSARLEQSLASLLARLGRWVEAAELLRRAVAARRRARGASDPASVEAAALLAEVEGDLGHTDAAAALLLEVLGIRGAQLGADHETTLDTALRLGWVLRERGSAAEAAQIAERLLTYAATLGRRHPIVLGARTLAAALLGEGGGVDAHDEAVVLLLEALHDCRVAVGSAHALTLGALAALGAAQGTVFRHSDAEHHVRQAVDGAAHLYGPHHPRTLALVGELAAELRASGQAPAALRALGDAPARAGGAPRRRPPHRPRAPRPRDLGAPRADGRGRRRPRGARRPDERGARPARARHAPVRRRAGGRARRRCADGRGRGRKGAEEEGGGGVRGADRGGGEAQLGLALAVGGAEGAAGVVRYESLD